MEKTQAAGRSQALGKDLLLEIPDLVSGGQNFTVADDREKLWPYTHIWVIF